MSGTTLIRNARLEQMPERFAAKVSIDTATGCWLWTAALSEDGYGAYWSDGGMRRAHRIAYETLVETLAADVVIDHKCFQPSCVNPAHLRAVSRKQNNEHLQGARVDSRSGVRGVFWDGKTNKWRVQVGHLGGRVYGGFFTSLEDAERKAIALRAELFTHDDGRTVTPTVTEMN
jgi:hypothetical protein